MSQPEWELIANLGDVTYLDHGGYFVFRDITGVYCEEAELLVAFEPFEINDQSVLDDETGEVVEEYDETIRYHVYRFSLDKCTYSNGILSDNPYHPEIPAWFAAHEAERASRPQDTTYLSNIVNCFGVGIEELVEMFCSPDPLDRAEAYRMAGEYHGWENLDSYPLELTRNEAKERYRK